MSALEQVTGKLLAVIQQEDFVQLNSVLAERDTLLAGGAEVTALAFESGEQASLALVSLKQNLILESSRLEQIRKMADPFPELSPQRNYLG